MLLAPFGEITANLGGVIRQLNERFGTDYVEFRPSEERLATVFHLIEERSRRPPWEYLVGEFLGGRISFEEYRERTADQPSATPRSEVPEDRVPRPSPLREAIKSRMLQHYMTPRLARLRTRAERAYEVARSLAQ